MTKKYTEEEWLNWLDELSEQNYIVIDNFLSDDLYAAIRAFFKARLEEDEFSRAAIGALHQNQINTGIRGDFTYWLNATRDVELQGFWDLLGETIEVLNRYCYLSLSGFEFHLANYPSGAYYKRHLDQFNNRSNRMISMVIYLNENWQTGDGGELEIFGDESSVRIEPIAKRCVLFKSADVEHAVCATTKSRYSLTGWLLYQPSGVGVLGIGV